MTDEILKNLRIEIAKGNLQEVVNYLVNIFNENSRYHLFRESILLLSSRLARVNNDFQKGLATRDELNTSINQLTFATLQLIKETLNLPEKNDRISIGSSIFDANNSVPILPNKIVVGLQDDLIQYNNELKYLLLFFERPVAYLSSTSNYIDEEAMDAARRGAKVVTNIWGDDDIKNIAVLETDDWMSTLNYCDVKHTKMHIEISNTYTDSAEEWGDEVWEIYNFINSLTGKSFKKKFKNKDEKTIYELGQWAVKMEITRLLGILKECKAENIPMIWATSTDLWISQEYSRYLLMKKTGATYQRSINAELRTINGFALLREIFNLNIVNIITIPPEDIIQFRNRNADLLNNFLTHYRYFLTNLQSNPQSLETILEEESNKVVRNLIEINEEINLLKRPRKYKWLEKISKNAYESSKDQTPIAKWGALGSILFQSLVSNSKSDNTDEYSELLLRNSSGYIWKISEQFK